MNLSSFVQIAFISLALVFGTIGPVVGQESKKSSSSAAEKSSKAAKPENTKKASVQRDFKEAAEYIQQVVSSLNPTPRGEFETREAYEARQPSLSTERPVLVRLERGYKDYSYNIDEKLLSIQIPLAKISPRKSLSGIPIQAAYELEDKGGYKASNAYGATVNVQKTYSTSYILYVPDTQLTGLVTEVENSALRNLPENLKSSLKTSLKNEKSIVLSLSADPANAEKISKNYAVLLRVRPKGLNNFVSEATHSSKPTISEPKESTLFTRAIEVDLLEIQVRDGSSGPILLQKVIEQPSASTSEPIPTAVSESK